MKQEDGLSSQMKLVFVFFVALFSSIENPGFVFGSTGNDILLPGQSLAPDQTLVSNNGAYQFGFFADYDYTKVADYDYIKDTYFWSIYIGYGSDNSDIIVWQANKEAPWPVTMSDPVLNLSESGDLVLVDQSDESHLIIWSPQVTGSETISVNLVLLNTGNLVLVDSKNSSRIMWQSFDHPTNTWLPGARLEINLSLIYTDRSYGYDSGPSFSLEIDPRTTHGFIIRQNSSSLTYHGMFPRWMDIRKDGDNLVTFYDTKEHSHLFVKLSPWQISIIQWANESIRVLWSEPNSPCDVDSVCGPYSLCLSGGYHGPDCSCLNDFTPKSIENWNNGIYEKGCTRSMSLDCEINKYNYHVGSFYWVNNINRFPDNSHSLAVKIEDECENSCFKDCSCTAFSYTNGNCSLWFGELLNAKTGHPDGYVVYVINIRKISMDYKHKSQTFQSRDHTIIIILILGLVVIISVVGVIFCLFKRVTLRNPSKINNFLVLYTYPQIKSITKTFSQKLGEGGFGTVFKGKLSDSSFVAVKKLKIVCYETEKQFRSEIQTIGIIQHVNLVRLLGFCAEGTKRLLIYEYMQNGSLNSHLFSNSSQILSWKTRYQVAVGIARGLAYLHGECRDCIIHCDIKPENILLDEHFCPKIADFGMAKLLGRDFSRALTTMRGTIGYLAPEWISGQPITQKADVYSFGMMLFEIISGRRNVEKIKNRECTYFPLYAAIKINQGKVLCLLDEKLEVNNSDVEEITIVCRVACWCIQDFEDDRLTMSQIVQMLEGNLQIEMPPIPNSLQNLVDIENGSSYFEPS